jgi:hypothetical protein
MNKENWLSKKEKFTAEDIFRKWARLALLNLLIVATAGLLLRIKIVFPLPAVDHKNLLHAHSHFAFSGWVSLALFAAITAIVHAQNTINSSVFRKLFWLGQFAAFGMLLTFPFMGYKAPSIAFSTLSIIFSYLFAILAWRKLSALPQLVKICFRSAMIFYIISSLGAFNLAWLMASENSSQRLYIGSVYFFLHFQYNGWFLFGIAGLFIYQLHQSGATVNWKNLKYGVYTLLAASVPAYLLSALWMRLPTPLYWLAVAAAIMQLIALVWLGKALHGIRRNFVQHLSTATKWLWLLAVTAFVIKIILQALSAIPSLSYLAFGFRPVVIGYLHLVLLGLVSLFLLGYFVHVRFLPADNRLTNTGLTIFTIGVMLNEGFLFLQGLAAINHTYIESMNYFLLAAAVIMVSGMLTLVISKDSIRIPSVKTSSPIKSAISPQ